MKGPVRSAVLVALAWAWTAAPARASESAARLQSATGGAVHALVVGIDDYVNVEPTLRGSVGDAEDIAAILRADGVADIRLLVDRQATRRAFVTEMQRLLDVSQPGDLAIVTYSGHGGTVPEYPEFKGLEPTGKTEEFIMVDYDTTGPNTGEVVANKEMKAWLTRLDGKGVDVLFVADSCFGGGMVRGLPDPRVGPPLLRVARNIAPQGGSSFEPIAMTPAELHADVSRLAHVTVLSGADRFTPVPEVFIPTPPTRRGALSYAVARALHGNAARPGSDLTTRRQLFAYARQEVQHYSDDQRIDNSPRPAQGESDTLDRPVFRMRTPAAMTASTPAAVMSPALPAAPVSTASPVPTATPVSTAMPAADASCPVQLAVIHDDANVASGIGPVGVPFQRATDPAKSDLVWDVRASQVIQSGGDIVADGVGPTRIAGVIRRTSAIACIKKLTEVRPQQLSLRDGVQRYTPGDAPMFEAQDVSGRYLVVFDLAADGRLQMVWPQQGHDEPMPQPTWTGSPDVIEPFGADYVVAVSSSRDLRDFLDWLNRNDNRLPGVAEQVPARLREIQSRDASSRIGAVALYTGATRPKTGE